MREYKLIVAGSRSFNDRQAVEDSLFQFATHQVPDQLISIVSGLARGADMLAYQFAVDNNIKVYEFPADWNRYGKSAGYRRNVEMANFSDGLLAFWDGMSRGTSHMIDIMRNQNKLVHCVHF